MQDENYFNRRNFLAKVGAFGIAGLVGGGSLELNWSSRPNREAKVLSMTADNFAKYLGQTFTIERADGEWVNAQLIQVAPQRTTTSAPRSPFSLTFRLHGTETLPHQTYNVEHAELGQFAIFLGAVGQPSPEVRLEAIFG